MNTNLRSIITIASLVTAGITPSIANATNAQQFMKGGEYCFRVGTSIPGGWNTTLKLIARSTGGSAPFKIAHLDALERGGQATFPPNTYVMPLTGSAVIAAPNNQLPGDKQLQISLSGSDLGTNAGISGVWSGSQVLTLNPVDLAGQVTGYKTFTPVQAGQLGEINTSAVDETITPISCSQF